MKIKEQDEQHMVIGLGLGQRFGLAFALVLVIAWGLIPQILGAPTTVRVIFGGVAILLGLVFLGGLIGGKIVIDKLTQTITVDTRYLLLIHRRHIFPLSDVWSVMIVYERQQQASGGSGPDGMTTTWRGKDAWKVSLNIGTKTFKVDHTTNYENMFNLASRISTFIGCDLTDKSAKR